MVQGHTLFDPLMSDVGYGISSATINNNNNNAASTAIFNQGAASAASAASAAGASITTVVKGRLYNRALYTSELVGNWRAGL